MVDTSTALTVIPSNGVDTYRMSTDAANICGAIVKATAQSIQGKKYVKVEGWQAIAIAHGCTASSRDVEVIDGGIRAIGEIRRMTDGFVIATAEGFVGDDEKMWSGRPMYARRAMAQTRAISRACRSAFAHVVVMIDASLSTTPAEEMGWDNGHGDQPHIIGATVHGVAPGDEHLVRGDGTSTYKLKAAEDAKKDADKFISTIGLSGQSVESLDSWWKANARRLKGMKDNHTEQYERVEKAFIDAKDAAEARAA